MMEEDSELQKRYIIDASFVLSFLLPDESQVNSDLFFKKAAGKEVQMIAPKLLPFEICNALRSAVIRKRISPQLAKKPAANFFKLPIEYKEIDYTKTLTFALDKNISFYDAAYARLAVVNKFQVLTLDNRLYTI